MRLLLDTSAFVAIEDLDDANHRQAMDFREKVRRGDTPFRALWGLCGCGQFLDFRHDLLKYGQSLALIHRHG